MSLSDVVVGNIPVDFARPAVPLNLIQRSILNSVGNASS